MRPIACSLLSLVFALGWTPGAVAQTDDEHAARMLAEHRHDAPVPSPAVVPEARQPVTAEAVAYATLDGRPVTGYLARPEARSPTPRPGLLVIHEWWGLNDNIRAMTRRLAGEGYVALAVDLYDGKVATDPDTALATMQAAMAHSDRLLDNLKQAHAYLRQKAGAGRTGVIGWCFGGGWSLETALALGADLDAAVVYYGRPQTDPAALVRLRAPLLGLFGGLDQGIPVDHVRAMEAELHKLGKDATIVVYDHADHAFANPSGTRYQPQAAEDAWRRTTEFLARHLRP
jgi:carboxymethylenebutenolidase